MKTPKEIVNLMMEGDAFSRWLGISVDKLDKGHCTLSCTVRAEMLNGHHIAHGGISYSLSDSALAFASNSYGNKCVSIETSISHLLPVKEGDILTAFCDEIHRGKTVAIYTVNIFNQREEKISMFKGTVNISREIW
ncbi:MAG: thioesterase [Fluviicola sp. XM-24bin1]|nr:MAG: thioesterase [Fluviicola sp. XM-24bin1]